MSEKFGKCPTCEGKGVIYKNSSMPAISHFEVTVQECPACDGTGFDGSADTYVKQQAAEDWEKDKPPTWKPKDIL